MAILEIQTMGAPVLRNKATKVKKVNEEIRKLCEDMIETMRVAPGVGLAAPQIGVPLRVIVVEVPEIEDEPLSGKLFAVVNPEIVAMSDEQEEGVEGCLSVPGFEGDVWRAVSVAVKGLDEHGKKVKIKARDFPARIFQHEIDHLNGTLYIDRVESPEHLRQYTPEEEEETSPAI